MLEGSVASIDAAYEKAMDKLMSDVESSRINYPNHIDGAIRMSETRFEDRSPIDEGIVVGLFQNATQEDVNDAVASAKGAFSMWSQLNFEDRVRIFLRAAEIMRIRKFDLAAAITLDNGKNRYEALSDVDEAIDFIEYYASQMLENGGFVMDTDPPYPNESTKSVLRPYGVWAVVCPFNFPAAIPTGMMTGALITGNTAVVKPSSIAPLPVYLVYEILAKAGLPDGVLNFLAGPGGKAGDALVNHPDVDGVVFTGSRSVGLEVMKESLRRDQRPVIAEMGSKNPTIITETANLDDAIAGIIASAFGYSGQKCSATSRLYILPGVYDEVVDRVMKEARKLKVGDPRDKDTFIGPVISRKAMDQYTEYVAMAARDGAFISGGMRNAKGNLERGYFVEPTVITGLPEDHFLMKNELFVPILCVQKASSLQDAIIRANDTRFGLTAGIFSQEELEIKYFMETIKFGVVYANRRRGASSGAMVAGQSFGGWKASGSTGKGTGGPYYLTQFLREQARTVVK